MSKVSINNGKITIDIKEGFIDMNVADYAGKGSGKQGKDEWAVKNEELHMILNIGWKKVPFLAGSVDIKKVADNTIEQVRSRCNKFEKLEDVQRTIAGQKACGFKYKYLAQGIDMISEYMLMKYDKHYYGIALMTREETYDECNKVYEEMLSSVELG